MTLPKDEPYVLPTEMHRRDKWHIRSDHLGYSLWFANEMRGRLFGQYAAGMPDDCKAVADALNEAAALTAERDSLRAAWQDLRDAMKFAQMIAVKLGAENKRLREALANMILLFDQGFDKSDTLGRMRCDEARQALGNDEQKQEIRN